MTTKNRRIAAYLPSAVEECFRNYQANKRLTDSAALVSILSEFFGLKAPENLNELYGIYVTVEEFDELKGKVDELLAMIQSLPGLGEK